VRLALFSWQPRLESSDAMNKYRRVPKPREALVKSDNEIRVTATGSVAGCISFAARVFNEMGKPDIKITATGNALAKALTVTEVLKLRFKGLHQVTRIREQVMVDEFEPLEEGLDKVVDTRSLPFAEFHLSKEQLDTTNVGYQPPIDEALVTEFDAEELARGRRRGKAKVKGKGVGKNKKRDKEDEEEEEEVELDEEKPKKSKEKTKGKSEEKMKEKEIGKDKSSGREKPHTSSKGTGKQKNQGNSSDYNAWNWGSSWDYNAWDSWGWNDWYDKATSGKGRGQVKKDKGWKGSGW